MNEVNATPHAELIAELINPNISKNDREHAAVREIEKLREALAQPKQEPVAHTTGHCENHKQKGGCQLHNLQCGWPDCDRKPITTPPQRKPLTNEEIWSAIRPLTKSDENCKTLVDVSMDEYRTIEAAHGIKENT